MPELRPQFPSREGTTAPGGRKRHQKRGANSERNGSTDGKAGESFFQADAGSGFMPKGMTSEHQGTRSVKDVGVKAGKAGGKFDPSRCGGHKNSENAATFSELLGQEDKLSPAPTTSRHTTRQPRPQVQHFRPPDFRSMQHFYPPETKPPSQYRQYAPISTTIAISGGRNRTGRVKTSPKEGAAGKYAVVRTGKGRGKFRPSRRR